MRISYQTMGLQAMGYMNRHEQSMADIMQRIAAGQRISSASDDVGGFQVSQKCLADLAGYNQSLKNVQSGLSYVKEVQANFLQMKDTLLKMSTLLDKKDTPHLTADELADINDELDELATVLKGLKSATSETGLSLVNQSLSIGTGAQGESTITLNLTETFDAIDSITNAVTKDELNALYSLIEKEESAVYGFKSRLEFNQGYTEVMIKNLQKANSRIQSIDEAKESMELTKYELLQQSAQAMVAQANQSATWVVDLINQSR